MRKKLERRQAANVSPEARAWREECADVRAALLFDNLNFENASIDARCTRTAGCAQRAGQFANFDAGEQTANLGSLKRSQSGFRPSCKMSQSVIGASQISKR